MTTKKIRTSNKKQRAQQMMFWYLVIGGISSVVYIVLAAIFNLPYIYATSPLWLLGIYLFNVFLVKNRYLIVTYITNYKRGCLLNYLKHTHFSFEHKKRLVAWVYPNKNQIRRERFAELAQKIKNGEGLTKEEKKEQKKKVVACPQQLVDGINEAILTDILIKAHNTIHVLDDKLREYRHLTDENIWNFSLSREMDKCRTKEVKDGK